MFRYILSSFLEVIFLTNNPLKPISGFAIKGNFNSWSCSFKSVSEIGEFSTCKIVFGLYFTGTNWIVVNLLSVPFPELFIIGLAALKKAACFAFAAK